MTKLRNKELPTPFLLGAYLLCVLFMTYAIECLGYILNIPLVPVAFPVSVILSSVYIYIMGHKNRMRILIIALLSIILFGIIAVYMTDYTYDGNKYHQEAVLKVTGGWNPFRDSVVFESIWTAHYAKYLESVSASIVAIVGDLQAGKLVNLILILSAGTISYGVLRQVYREVPGRQIAILTAIVTLNPIVVEQMFTYYIDFALSCELQILLSLFLLLYKGYSSKLIWVLLAVVTMISANTKFTHIFYVGVAWVAFIIISYLKNQRSLSYKSIAISLLSAVAGIVVLGYHPYITNLVNNGHVFYPIMGKCGTVDIMTCNTPVEYLEMDRFRAFFDSYFMPHGIVSSVGCDSRYGAFGFLFPVIILVAVLSYIGSCRNKMAELVALLIVLSCFIFEQSWWGRYVPFLWFAPSCLYGSVVLCGSSEESKLSRLGSRGYEVLCFASITFIIMISVAHGVRETLFRRDLNSVLEHRQEVRGNLDGWASSIYYIEHQGLKLDSHPKDSLDLGHALYMIGREDFSYPMIELTDAEIAELESRNTYLNHAIRKVKP